MRKCTVLAALSLILGCNKAPGPVAKGPPPPQPVVPAVDPPAAQQPRRAATSLRSDYGRESTTRYRRGSANTKLSEAGFGVEEAVDQVAGLLREAMEQGEVLVVWFLDGTKNADEQRASATRAIVRHYRQFADAALDGAQTDSLLTAIVQIGETNSVLVEEPSRDFGDAIEALSGIKATEPDRESTFASVGEAVDRYATVRRQGTEVYFIIVTNEVGDDEQVADGTIAKAKRLAIPVYVIGPPAPFGRCVVGATRSTDRRGPESAELERIRLGFFDADRSLDLLDSGFGPYSLERLCQSTGGTYLVTRPKQTQRFSLRVAANEWPSPTAKQFNKRTMRRYRPRYQSPAANQQDRAENAARMALHQAAQLAPIKFDQQLSLQFSPRNQADLVRQLTEAQKRPARIALPLKALYDALAQGESARADLKSPRLQAGYDLAFGRACAAKARVDGYNEQLAALKRDGVFKEPGSTQWVLEPTDTSEMSSSVNNLAKKAIKLLNGVVADHAGTPWALLAEQELRTPLGWQWTER